MEQLTEEQKRLLPKVVVAEIERIQYADGTFKFKPVVQMEYPLFFGLFRHCKSYEVCKNYTDWTKYDIYLHEGSNSSTFSDYNEAVEQMHLAIEKWQKSVLQKTVIEKLIV